MRTLSFSIRSRQTRLPLLFLSADLSLSRHLGAKSASQRPQSAHCRLLSALQLPQNKPQRPLSASRPNLAALNSLRRHLSALLLHMSALILLWSADRRLNPWSPSLE